MSGRFETSALFLRVVAEHLSLKEISGLIASGETDTVDLFSQISLNLLTTENFDLTAEDKTSLKPFRKQLQIIVNKKEPLQNRRVALVTKPLIAKILAQLALKCASDIFS